MRKLAMAVAAAMLLLPAVASAQFVLGLRAAYGIPMGTAFDSDPVLGPKAEMKDFINRVIPLQVEAGYKLTPNFTLGLYYAYGFANVNGAQADAICVTGIDCSASDQRAGVQAFWSFAPGQPIDLWIGAATGWEWFTFKAEGGGATVKASLNGWEYITVQAGVDFALSRSFALSPYASYGLGQFSKYSLDVPGLASESGSISSKATHSQFQIGGRATFKF